MQYQISGYLPMHERRVAQFQQLLWRGGPSRNAAYLAWKYHQNPYLDDRYVVLAWAGDDLVGMLGGFGSCWEAPAGGTIILPCLADTLVAPDHRGGPLFRGLLDHLTDQLRRSGVPWLLDFGDQGAVPSMLMQGWKAIGPWAVATLVRKSPSAMHGMWPEADAFEASGPRSGIPIRVIRSVREAAALSTIADFVARLPTTERVRHVRDATYLAWRFSNPLARFFGLAAGSKEMKGFLIAHRSGVADGIDKPTPTTIVDCEADTDEIWIDLVHIAASMLPGHSILCWARDVSSARLGGLVSVGFTLDEPTGRLTRDWHLPNLILRSTSVIEESSPFATLQSQSAWDLRAICGRCWR